jgi:putative glutathione S-transferase
VANSAPPTTDDGRYERQPFRFTARITADGRDGWPAEPDRYRLVVSRACPWASRSLVTRRLMGLEDAIGLAVADPIQDDRSWRFTLDPGGVDPVLGIAFLADAYYKADPDYDGGVSVPAIVDVGTGAVVTNDVFQVTLDLATEWRAHAREGAPDLYPEPLRAEIDEVNARTYADLNAAVYEAGFATTQSAYEDAYRRVFGCLDWLAERLADRRYLMGDTITEADIRVFTTLIRFDAVYHTHFKNNRNKITEMPTRISPTAVRRQPDVGLGDRVAHQVPPVRQVVGVALEGCHGPHVPDPEWAIPCSCIESGQRTTNDV